MVKEEAEGRGVACLAGLLAIHFIEHAVDQVRSCLQVAPPGVYLALEVSAEAEEEQKAGYDSKEEPYQCYLN